MSNPNSFVNKNTIHAQIQDMHVLHERPGIYFTSDTW